MDTLSIVLPNGCNIRLEAYVIDRLKELAFVNDKPRELDAYEELVLAIAAPCLNDWWI